MRTRLTCGLLIGAVTLGASARAAARFHPLLQLTAQERYDDDLILQKEDGGGGELMSELSPRLGFEVDDHTWDVKTWYAADLLYHHGSGALTVDHRGALSVAKELGPRAKVSGDVEVWRVTDPTSLPRMDLAETLSPVLYGRAKLEGSYQLGRRWTGKLGLNGEAVQVLAAGHALGYYQAPYTELDHRLTARTTVGAGYRFELFHFGEDLATSNGVFGRWSYRLSRETTARVLAGPVQFVERGRPDRSGWLPRFDLELDRHGPRVDYGLTLGHDLVGASGVTTAVWADYAYATASWKLTRAVTLTAAGSLFRNGQAANQLAFTGTLSAPGLASGYAAGLELAWTVSKTWMFKATVNRYGQEGGGTGAPRFARNLFAVRAIATAW